MGLADSHKPSSPRAPTCSVNDYGAVGDGETDDTEAIQLAVHVCSASAGVVLFGSNRTYLTGQIIVNGSVNLQLQGSTLLASPQVGTGACARPGSLMPALPMLFQLPFTAVRGFAGPMVQDWACKHGSHGSCLFSCFLFAAASKVQRRPQPSGPCAPSPQAVHRLPG